MDAVTINARLTALRKAYHSGALVVRHGETSTTYRSLSEIRQIIVELEGDLAGLTTTPKRVRYVHQVRKGL